MSREAEVGGDDEAVEPVGTWRHLAFPMTVRSTEIHRIKRRGSQTSLV